MQQWQVQAGDGYNLDSITEREVKKKNICLLLQPAEK